MLAAPGEGSLPPVLMLHGFGASGSQMLPVLLRLKRHARRIIVPDMPGHGFSEIPEDVPIAVALLDSLAPALVSLALGRELEPAATKRAPSAVRKALLELSKFSLLQGSIQKGLYMHDIVYAAPSPRRLRTYDH